MICSVHWHKICFLKIFFGAIWQPWITENSRKYTSSSTKVSFITNKDKATLLAMRYCELDFNIHDKSNISFTGRKKKGGNVAMKALLTQAGAPGLPSKK